MSSRTGGRDYDRLFCSKFFKQRLRSLIMGCCMYFLGVYEDPTVRCMGAGVALMVDARASRQRHIFKPA